MQSSLALPLDFAAALGFAAPAHLRPELADRRPLHRRHLAPSCVLPHRGPSGDEASLSGRALHSVQSPGGDIPHPMWRL